jgi:hypothetical protein
MHLSVSALGAAILALSWESDPSLTYTLQTSPDLTNWSTLPSIFTGDGEPLSHALPNSAEPLFARLRWSREGDTNENGLPDQWEWRTFGYLDVPPQADPDLDGIPTLEEWRTGTDPFDPYNGQSPIIRIGSGTTWQVPPATTSDAFTDLQLRDRRGAPLPDHPITVTTRSGEPCLIPADDHGTPEAPVATPASHWELRTDPFGNIRLRNGLRYRHHEQRSGRDAIIITAGQASLIIDIVLDAPPETNPGMPRSLTWKRVPDNRTEISWSGSPDPSSEIYFEIYDRLHGWRLVDRLSTADLSQPDPVTGRFTHTIPNEQP